MHGSKETTEHTPKGFHLFCFWGGGWGGVKMEKKISCVPIMFSYVGSKNIILGKAYWTKWGAIRNIWGIPWELGEHVYHWVNWEQMRTSCEHIENKIIPKIQTPTPTNPKRIKTGMFRFIIGWAEIPTVFITYFGLG